MAFGKRSELTLNIASAVRYPGRVRGLPAVRRTTENISVSGIRRKQVLLAVAALVLVLAADIHTGLIGQDAISVGVWGLLLYLLARVDRNQRTALMTCLVIATAGEMFCSLVWGLYTYRLGNIPQFVPPGHVLMLLLGMSLARRMPEVVAVAIITCAGVYAFAAAAAGVDSFAVPLFLVLALASFAMPRQRRLFASTFVLALALELYGTWLGNWTWAHTVPGTPLVTTNPPGAAGAFYCALDAMVAATALVLTRQSSTRSEWVGTSSKGLAGSRWLLIGSRCQLTARR